MATKQLIRRLIDRYNDRQRRQGLPLINQMIEDDKDEAGPESIRVAGAWMTDDELTKYSQLLMKETMWVSVQICVNEKDMIEGYGVRDGGEGEKNMYEVTPQMTDHEAILHVTRNNECWGEWIGGCVGTFHNFSQQLQNELHPVLMKAIEFAVEHGVDH